MKPDLTDDPLDFAARRPEFFDTPGVDCLFGMCVALTEQLALANERHDTLARVLAEKGLINLQELSNYQPDAQAEAARAQLHQELVRDVLRVLDEALDAQNDKGEA